MLLSATNLVLFVASDYHIITEILGIIAFLSGSCMRIRLAPVLLICELEHECRAVGFLLGGARVGAGCWRLGCPLIRLDQASFIAQSMLQDQCLAPLLATWECNLVGNLCRRGTCISHFILLVHPNAYYKIISKNRTVKIDS